MSNDLHLEAIRDITVNTSNKQETQSYYIDLMQIKESQGASEIANSEDPFKAYCDHVKELERKHSWEEEPVYLWDVDKSVEAYNKHLNCIFEEDNINEYIVGYKKASDRLIEDVEEKIKTALENGYKLNWQVW